MSETSPPSLRDAIEAAVAAGDASLARYLLSEYWREKRGPAAAGFVVSRFERLRGALSLHAARVTVLRSCTLEPVVPVLRASAFTAGLDLTVEVGDFNAYTQEILDPESALYRNQPDVVFLAVHTADVAPELWDGFADLSESALGAVVARVTEAVRGLLQSFRARSRAELVVHGLELPLATSKGVLDDQAELGQREAVRSINRALLAAAREHKGVYVLDYDALIARHGRDGWYDPQKWATLHLPLRAERLTALADEWLRFLLPALGKVKKALVVDLDNTLWGGVVGEDGLENLKLGREFPGSAFTALQRAILDLYKRGVILAVCSKNNPADALEVFEKHPDMLLRKEHFAALRINWQDKASNLRSIAEELNIGVDALAFLDDNPAERELVRRQLPEVTVLELPEDPARYAATLRDCPVFERLSLSSEDSERGRYYAEERQRTELQQRSASLEDFYRSLEIRVKLAPVTAETLARTSQLTQKTNQFNLTTRRYTELDLQGMLASPNHGVYAVAARDRFGDNGLVGVAILEFHESECELDTLLLSCRVIGRTIETALLAALCEDARARGAALLRGKYIATKKNGPCREFFATHGFSCVEEGPTESSWSLDLTARIPACPAWIECTRG